MRGKKVDVNEYLANIEPFMHQGLTMHEACLQSYTPYRTMKDYYDNDEAVRIKVQRMEQYAVVVAKETLLKGIRRDPNLALKYLERKRKDEFSLRTETDLTSLGEKINTALVRFEDGDDRDKTS